MHHRILPVFVSAAVSLLAATSIAAPAWKFEPPKSNMAAGSWFDQHDWEEQRGSWDAWRFRDGALKLRQDDDSTMVGKKLGNLSISKAKVLRFEFSVQKAPAGADLRRASTEDAALRIFVVFDRGGGLLSPPDTLAYAFGDPSRKGIFDTSDRFDNVKYIVVAGGPGELNKRLKIQRDLAKDYKRAFGRSAPAIKAIGIKSDTNDTETKAAATVFSVSLSSE